MERRFKFTVGEHYHVFNRGVDKRNIFQSEADYHRFQELLYLANGTKPVVYNRIQGLPLDWDRGDTRASVIAYALMPNHFHLVVRENTDGGISKFIGKLATAYSMYFNTRHDRSGTLMNHPFRARHIDSDEYFRWVMSYVHLNPVPDAMRNDLIHSSAHLRRFAYSSYHDYFVGERKEGAILDKTALPIPVSDLETVQAMLSLVGLRQGLPLDAGGDMG